MGELNQAPCPLGLIDPPRVPHFRPPIPDPDRARILMQTILTKNVAQERDVYDCDVAWAECLRRNMASGAAVKAAGPPVAPRKAQAAITQTAAKAA